MKGSLLPVRGRHCHVWQHMPYPAAFAGRAGLLLLLFLLSLGLLAVQKLSLLFIRKRLEIRVCV